MIDHVASKILTLAAGAVLSPEEALEVLNTLPQHDLVLAAVLSRGFKEFSPALAIKHNRANLLLHHPAYILFDGLKGTLYAAGARGDIATIELLWRLAGPTSPARVAWFGEYGPIYEAIQGNHVPALEWLSQAAHAAVDIPFKGKYWFWCAAAEEGHTDLIHWAIENDHIRDLNRSAALLSTRNGDASVADWWIKIHTDQYEPFTEFDDKNPLILASKSNAIGALDWWWAYNGAKFPPSRAMEKIAEEVLLSCDLKVVEWWWSRFLEHRTPEHTFGTMREAGRFQHASNLDWYQKHYHDAPELFASEGDGRFPYGLDFVFKSQTTLPVLQWAVTKCSGLDGQKLLLTTDFFHACASRGQTDVLDLALRSADVADAAWPHDFLIHAIQYGQLALLEWWDANQNALPSQNFKNVLSACMKRCAWMQ